MRVKDEQYHDVGVIVGRFQVPELHDAHKELIQHVCDQHDKVILFLGLSPLMVTRENPLDFEARKQMILECFPDVNVLYIKDMPSDHVWSVKLDEMIEDLVTPSQSVMLYGGRDSFVDKYEGKYDTTVLESEVYYSGTAIRQDVSRRSVKASPDFRAGVVWAAYSKFPTAYMCVDVAIFDENEERILLVRKSYEKKWRLPGGFVEPGSPSLEANARREAQEETGVAITDPKYVGSFYINDWRYRGETDAIMTALFKCKYLSGPVKANDDVAEARWFDTNSISDGDVVDNHTELINAVIEKRFSQR